jgi:gliding motility-associated-like protein
MQTAAGTVGITGSLSVDAGTSITIPMGTSTTLIGTGSADWTYSWSPPGTLSCPACQTTTATPIVMTTYTLSVSSDGCTGSDTVTVNIDYTCGELFVPTAFSPNDDGNGNDVLKVYGKCITNLNFAIFDRWGEKIFETSDPAVGWDGTFKGKKLDTAVFVYYLTATWNGTEVKQHGNVTLVK